MKVKDGVAKMKKYYIYDMQTDEKIGEVMAMSVTLAEIKFIKENVIYGGNDVYALSVDE